MERRRQVLSKIGEPVLDPGGGGGVTGPPRYQQFVAQKAASQFSLPKEARYSKPSGTPEPPAAKAPYVKPKSVYEIWRKPIGREKEQKVGEASSLKHASRSIDRRDNEYGGYIHYKKKIGD